MSDATTNAPEIDLPWESTTTRIFESEKWGSDATPPARAVDPCLPPTLLRSLLTPFP